jgi:hypothetical protein
MLVSVLMNGTFERFLAAFPPHLKLGHEGFLLQSFPLPLGQRGLLKSLKD